MDKEKIEEEKKSIVTGTDADLRKLSMNHVRKILLNHGYNSEHLSKLARWEKIDLLREISNAKSKFSEDIGENENNTNNLSKYARKLRVTTKMQKEKYQRDINKLFGKLIECLSVINESEIKSDNEFEIEDDEILCEKLFEDIVKQEKIIISNMNEKIEKEKIQNEEDSNENSDHILDIAKMYSKENWNKNKL